MRRQVASQPRNEIASIDIHPTREDEDMNESYLVKLLSQEFACFEVTNALYEVDTYPVQRGMFELYGRSD
jgi:hypothetical protein